MWTERKVQLRQLSFPSRLSLPPEGSVEQQEKEVWQCTALVPAVPLLFQKFHFWLAMAGNCSRIMPEGRKKPLSRAFCSVPLPIRKSLGA